jgi:bacteriocin-like protein
MNPERELTIDELDAVSGGLVVPSIIGILIGPLDPGPISVKEPAPTKHWFNGG